VGLSPFAIRYLLWFTPLFLSAPLSTYSLRYVDIYITARRPEMYLSPTGTPGITALNLVVFSDSESNVAWNYLRDPLFSLSSLSLFSSLISLGLTRALQVALQYIC
jgi:hypothetical protein